MAQLMSNSPVEQRLFDINSDTQSELLSSSDLSAKQSLVQLNQWISKIQNSAEIIRHSPNNMTYLNSILGPVQNKEQYVCLDNRLIEALIALEEDEQQMTENCLDIVFKIDKKVFIESIDFYQKATNTASSIMKIDLEIKEENYKTKWVNVYKARVPITVQSMHQFFSPKLMATSFKSDTVRVTLSGDVKSLDAIEIRGSLHENDARSGQNMKIDPLKEYSLLPRQLHSLINSDLFSDVVFEVEGQKIPAHRNILICRSDYFRAMLSEKSKFTESRAPLNRSNSLSSIYIGDITSETFQQVLNFIYTGHIDLPNFHCHTAVELMRAADKMNLVELEKLCLYHLSQIINEDNVCKIYKAIHEKKPFVEPVLQMCHDQISIKFAYISKTDVFCSLPQELMIKIIENVIPKLSRITSIQVNEIDRPDLPTLEIPTNDDAPENNEELNTPGSTDDETDFYD